METMMNKDTLQQGRERLSDAADTIRETLQDNLEELRERGESMISEAKQGADDFWETVQTAVQENPGTSVAIALVAGALLGAIFLSRKD